MIQTLFGSLDEKEKPSFLERMKEAVTRTRENLSDRIEEVVSFGKEIDRNTLDDLEATLIGADLGSTTTHEVLQKLRDKADRKQIKDVEELKRLLKEELLAILSASNNRAVQKVDGVPEVILVVGESMELAKRRPSANWRRCYGPTERQFCCARQILSVRLLSSSWRSGDNAPGRK